MNLRHFERALNAGIRRGATIQLTNEMCAMLKRELGDVLVALDESVKLQSHQAKMLNMYDGGKRRTFASAQAWIDRVRECRALAEGTSPEGEVTP